MNIYSENDYRSIIRNWQKNKTNKSFREIADKLGIQATYLSKCLNGVHSHLSEDLLFDLCLELGLTKTHADYILLLRQQDICTSPQRRLMIQEKISLLQSEHSIGQKGADIENINRLEKINLSYTLSPLHILVHAALDIGTIRRQPTLLEANLGISPTLLEDILGDLNKWGLIKQAENGDIKEVKSPVVHLQSGQSVTEAHQIGMRQQCYAHLPRISNSQKTNFMVTFSCDKKCAEEIKAVLLQAMTQVRNLAEKTTHRHLYQLNIDFFPWL